MNDFVVINETQDIGALLSRNADGSLEVRVSGTARTYPAEAVTVLTEEQVAVLDAAVKLAAEAIDRYYEEDVYGPVYNEDGEIVYSNAARAVVRALALPALLIALNKQAQRLNLAESECV